jgi:hypothetical protein
MIALALIAAATPPAPRPVLAQATASVRIQRPVSVDQREWERLPKSARRETIIRDEQGRELLLRLLEQQ